MKGRHNFPRGNYKQGLIKTNKAAKKRSVTSAVDNLVRITYSHAQQKTKSAQFVPNEDTLKRYADRQTLIICKKRIEANVKKKRKKPPRKMITIRGLRRIFIDKRLGRHTTGQLR